MPLIVRWLRSAGWPLSQQRTIFSKTHKTSSLSTIHVMVYFVIILGSLNIPHTDGHNLEEHWKDSVHRKKLPTISPNERRRSHNLHSSSRAFQNENDPIPPNRFTTSVKKRSRVGMSPLHPSKDRRTTTSWLHPKNTTINNHQWRSTISARNRHGEISKIVNSSRLSTNNHGSSKWRTSNFGLSTENTPVSISFGSTASYIQTNPVVPEASLTYLTKNQESRKNKSNREKHLITPDLAEKPTESQNAVTTSSFSPQTLNRELPVTRRKSIGRKSLSSKSRDTSKTTASTLYPRSVEISSAYRRGSKKGSDREVPKTFPSHVPNAKSKISPTRQMSSKTSPMINSVTTVFAPKDPMINQVSLKKFTLPIDTGKLKDKSSKISKRNNGTINTPQDSIIDTLKPSWFPYSSNKPSQNFQSNPIINTPTQILLTLPTKLNSQIDLSSLARDTDKPVVSTMKQKRSSFTPIFATTNLLADNIPLSKKGNSISNSEKSSPTPMTLPAIIKTQKRRRRKKNKNKKIQRVNKTGNKKPSFDSQRWLDINDLEIREGSAEDGLAWLKESRSEARVPASVLKENWIERNGDRQTAKDVRRLFKTGLPPNDADESDLKSQTNRSPSIVRFISKRRKGNFRDKKIKDNIFQKTKFPNFEPSKSSGPNPDIKDFSHLHFAKIGAVLKTTVKRSARPINAITPIPNEKKNGADSKKRKFLPREQKNKTDDLQIPNLEAITVDETRSSFQSDSVKKDVIHSKKQHSVFDHDVASESKNRKKQTMVELNKQTTDDASALYPFKKDNVSTLKSKTNTWFSDNQPVFSNMISVISTPSTKNYSAAHENTQIGSYHQKDSLHATTVDNTPKMSTSLPFAFDKKNPNKKKLGFSETQTVYSVINDTTQVPAHFSSRIIRGTDGSRSPQILPATASSDKNEAIDKSSLYKQEKNDSSIEKDFNIKLPSTSMSIQQQTTKSFRPSLSEITPVQVTESTESRISSPRSDIPSELMQHATISIHQADNTDSKNKFLTYGDFTSSPSPRRTKNSSDLVNLHDKHRQINGLTSNEGFVKERSSSGTYQRTEDIFKEASSSSRAISVETSTAISTTLTLSTPKSRPNKNSSEVGSTTKRLSSVESATTVSADNPNLGTSRFIATSTKENVRDNKITPPEAISHNDRHNFLHQTTSLPSSFLSFSTSKSRSSSSSIPGPGKTQSTSSLQPAKSSSPVLTNNIHKMTTTPAFFVRTPNTTLQVSKERQDTQHRSTTKPLIKRPQSSKTEPSKFSSITFTMSPTTKTATDSRKISIASNDKTLKGTTTKKPLKENITPMSSIKTENFKSTPRLKSTKNTINSEITISVANNEESISTPDPAYTVSLKEHDEQPKPPLLPNSPDYEELLVKCKVKPNIDINGSDFVNDIKKGLVNSYLEGQDLLNQRKAGSTNKRRKRETIGYVLEQQIDSHAVHYEDTEGIEAKLLRRSRRDQLVEIYFQMLEYGSVIDTDTAINVFSQLQITEISVNLNYPIYHQIEAIKQVMFQSQHPLKPSATKWMMVTIAAPSIPVFCVICILLTSWYRNHARLRRKAMAEISRGSQYAESLADVGLEIDMEKGEIVSRAGSTSVLWADFAAGDTLERMGMAGDFPNTDGESSRSNSWNARDSRTNANQSGRGRRQSPVARQCQRNGKYVKKKDSISSFHFENNLEDECPPVYESFEPALSDNGQWPRTSTLQSRTTPGRHLPDQQRKDISSTSQIYGDSVLSSSQKMRPTLHANIISHFLAELDTM